MLSNCLWDIYHLELFDYWKTFWRRFPTVEQRAGLYQEGNSLTPIPSDQELGDAVLKELGLRRKLGTYQDEVCTTNILCSSSKTFRLVWQMKLLVYSTKNRAKDQQHVFQFTIILHVHVQLYPIKYSFRTRLSEKKFGASWPLSFQIKSPA